ncbi:MAG: phosphopyruvate hydratase [Planctomycetota bacterium]|nr:phosphopyruvate hydratase [Planctomycetota bacterium]
MTRIQRLKAREILDSRGHPTLEVDLYVDSGVVGRAQVPSGASRGRHEAVEVRDGDARYGGKGVRKAVRNIEDRIAPVLVGREVLRQPEIDRLLIELDGTEDRSSLGANAILAVSIASAKAAANSLRIPLFRYLGGAGGNLLPVPLFNVINGGAHAGNALEIQEFQIVPSGAESFSEALQMGAEIYHALGSVLDEKGLETGVGDEGGYAPEVSGAREALDLLMVAIGKAGYDAGNRVKLALDVAATELMKGSGYRLEGADRDAHGMIDFYRELVETYPIASIEDGLGEDDWTGWKDLTAALGDRIQILGDDLFVTRKERLERGIEEGSANAILIKWNQVGTVTETLDTIRSAQRAGLRTVISHRSGDTEDPSIADLAVGMMAGQIKSGAPCRSERTSKYNQLLRIEEELGEEGKYGYQA